VSLACACPQALVLQQGDQLDLAWAPTTLSPRLSPPVLGSHVSLPGTSTLGYPAGLGHLKPRPVQAGAGRTGDGTRVGAQGREGSRPRALHLSLEPQGGEQELPWPLSTQLSRSLSSCPRCPCPAVELGSIERIPEGGGG
jgi:hypothetical protein